MNQNADLQEFACAADPTAIADPDFAEPEADHLPDDTQQDSYLDQICNEWAAWCRTRRYYGPPPVSGTVLGNLTRKTRVVRRAAHDPACRPDLAALHLAIAAQPMAVDRRVFELYYVYRVGNIKLAAATMEISRQHWYRLLREFRRRVWAAAREIQNTNEGARVALPHLQLQR